MLMKVIPRIKGGIGNQLFIFAAARRLSVVNNAELVLDHVSGFERDFKYKRHYQLGHFNITNRLATPSERLLPFSRVRRLLLRYQSSLKDFNDRAYLDQEGLDFDHRLLNFQPSPIQYLEGDWQSESYFKDIEPIIRSDLKIIPPNDMKNKQIASLIENTNSVALHVRFFDSTPNEEDFKSSNNKSDNTPINYYTKAIKELASLTPSPHYFVFSDRPEEVPKYLALDPSEFTVINHNKGDYLAYADLWLMSQCKHFIIANSTFSWWGAWLKSSKEKIVIAPNPCRFKSDNYWNTVGLIPKEWRLL